MMIGGAGRETENPSDVLGFGAENGARTRDLALRGQKRRVTPWRQGRRPLGGQVEVAGCRERVETENPSDMLGLGAENGARTRDLNLGKVALYQLSYFRVGIAKV